MATDVVMPQMGESIAEGTIVRWIKKVGDPVDRDEPLFEISTDKVDAEIPSPAAGVVTEIRAKEGETVAVNSVVAVIGSASSETAAVPGTQAAPEVTPPPRESAAAPAVLAPPPPVSHADVARPSGAAAVDGGDRRRTSPLVRRIAKERNVDLSQVPGTGDAGRVTKQDILQYLEAAPTAAPPGAPRAARPAPPPLPNAPVVERPVFAGDDNTTSVPLSVMRKRIAEHMVLSRRTSAHVHSVFEVNFSRVDQARRARKAEFERAGAKLTFMSFIARAAVDALHAIPVVNASLDGEQIVYHRDVNIGIAVALDWGLIVPVVKRADQLNLLGLSVAIADLAARARHKRLAPDDVAGGTFTITNPGVFGALFGMPIINQPQVAILGVGSIEKRPIVVNDAIAIRSMAYLTLGYDHRLIDGAVADQFMSHLKHTLEQWPLDDEGA